MSDELKILSHGFTMLPSYYKAVRPLPDEERWPLWDAIMDYVFQGVYPTELPTHPMGYFELMQPNIDSSIKHYTASVENGKKAGGRLNQNPVKTQQKPKQNPIKTVRRRRRRKRRKIVRRTMRRRRKRKRSVMRLWRILRFRPLGQPTENDSVSMAGCA